MAEITDVGYKLKPLNEWFEEERALYLGIDAEWNLDPSTPDGLKLAHDSEIFATLDELIQQAYNSKDPNKAKGVDLDLVCLINDTRRDKGSPSSVPVKLGGVPGTFVDAGKRVQSSVDGSEWATTSAVTFDSQGEGFTTAVCTENGATEAAINTVTQIIDVVPGWQTVTNTAVATLGRGRQNDPSLRVKRKQQVGKASSNQVEAFYGALYDVEGVRHVKVYENEEDAADADGLPGHSYAILVDGGSDDDCARAIFNKRSTGVKQHQPGTPVTKSVQSLKYPNLVRIIKFSRPIYADIVVAVTIKNDGSLPSDIVDRVKAAIISYTVGDLLDPDCGFNSLGFTIAEDVTISRMYTPINSVIGAYGASYVTALTLNGSANNVAIAFNGMARFSSSNITVNIT